MLTIMKQFMPKHKDALYGIMVDWCLAKVNQYIDTDLEKSVYWTKQACKYMLKRIDNLQKLGRGFM